MGETYVKYMNKKSMIIFSVFFFTLRVHHLSAVFRHNFHFSISCSQCLILPSGKASNPSFFLGLSPKSVTTPFFNQGLSPEKLGFLLTPSLLDICLIFVCNSPLAECFVTSHVLYVVMQHLFQLFSDVLSVTKNVFKQTLLFNALGSFQD